MNRNLRRLIYISMAVSAVILAAYPLRFILLGRGISSDPGDWGTFGDYVGGILGTVFGFAAFLVVLLTLNFQQRQQSIQELQRLLSTIAAVIDGKLDMPLHVEDIFNASHTYYASVRAFLMMEGTRAIHDGHSGEIQHPQMAEVGVIARALSYEMTQLVSCLKEYSKAGGGSFVTHHYGYRYIGFVLYMHALGQFLNTEVHQHFNTGEMIEQLNQLKLDGKLPQ